MLHTIFSFVGRVAGFSPSGFFSGSPSPGPLGVPLGPSWTFSGVCGDIRGLGCAAGVGGAGGGFAAGIGCTGGVFAIGVGGICLKLNFAAVAVGVVDAGGRFAAGVGDAGGGFATGVGSTGGGLPLGLALPMSAALLANNRNNIRLQTS